MAKADPIAAAWSGIEKWLEDNAPSIHETLAKGAPEPAVRKLEGVIGAPLPADVRASYRRHDGAEGSDLFPALERDEMGYSLMSLSEIPAVWRGQTRHTPAADEEFTADPGVRAEYWNRGWIPVATNGGGDFHFIDLTPAKGGKTGQVVEWRHETGERRIIAPSWRQRLEDLADGVGGGRYAFEDGVGIVIARKKPKGKPKGGAAKPAAATRKLSKRDKEFLRLAREPGPPMDEDDRRNHYWERLGYTAAVRALDPRLKHFGPCRKPQGRAIDMLQGGAELSMFYYNYAPRAGFVVNGIRLLSVEELAEATVALRVDGLAVFAVNDATGLRFAFDTSRREIPIVRVPAGVTPPAPVSRGGKKDKRLEAALGPDAAAHISDFLKKLASPKHRLNG
jgi:cell wall assembly regulator SMI1